MSERPPKVGVKRTIAWTTLVVLVLVWTCVSYTSQADPGLREEVLLRHFVVNAALSFPTSLVVGLSVDSIAGPWCGETGLGRAALISTVCLLSGYLQWLVAVPRLVHFWKTRSRSS